MILKFLQLTINSSIIFLFKDFKTEFGVWMNIEILVSDLNPMFMGYYSRNAKKLEIDKINSLGFQISDKQQGEFKLEIMHVKALY